MNPAPQTALLDDRRWRTAVIAMGIIGLVVGGYVIGRHRPATAQQESVRCLSATGTISCNLADGSTIAVPRDVSWTDRVGTFHEGGRPACLPPTGIGLEGPVRISWVHAELDGTGRRQVVAVDCRG